MLSALIFDVDGTLLDTNDSHVESWRRAFERFGYRIDSDRIEMEIGKGGDQLVPSILGRTANERDGDRLREASGEEFLKIAGEERFRPFPGAVELVRAIRDRGLKVAIATSASRRNLEAMERSSGISFDELADEMIDADDASATKPKPDLVVAAYEKLGVSPGECAMVGDTIYDAIACRHAGVVLLGLLTGYNSESGMIAAGARRVWHDTAHLLAELDHALEIASPGPVRLTRDLMFSLMREALAVAREGMGKGEAPIGCLLARGDGTIVARGYNEMQMSGNKVAHAEIVAFGRAAGAVPLDARDLILVSTLEPCVMCTGAAMQSAVDAIIYALRAPADSGTGRIRSPQSPENQMPRIIGEVLADESRDLFEEWLKKHETSEQAPYIRQLLAMTGGS
jgi:HAD superfamily hydrolase (TIGR01549 family)